MNYEKHKNYIFNYAMKSLLPISGVALALVLSTPIAQAEDVPSDDANWGQWQALGGGYVARRRQPPKLDLPRSERRQANVQVRLKHLLRKKQDLLASLEGLSNENAARIQKKLEILDKQIAKQTKVEQLLASKRPGSTTDLWLHTGEEGLYVVSISDLSAKLKQPQGKVRAVAKKGDLVLTTAETLDSETADSPVSWYYDGSTDSVFFVGESYDTFYSDKNAYRLSLGSNNSEKAVAMKTSKAKATKSTGAQTSFRDSLHFEVEPDFHYFTWAMNDEPDGDFWFWRILYGTGSSFEVNLKVPNPVNTGVAQLRVTLRGFTAFNSAYEHEIYAILNGVPVGTSIIWNGMQEAILVTDFDQSILNSSGDNTLVLQQGGTETSGEILDQIEIDYQRLPVAQNGKLWLHDVSAGSQAVSGFSSQNITVIESPGGEAVIRKDILIEPAGDAWTVSFDAEAEVDYLVTESSAIAASSTHTNYSAGLRNTSNYVDYLIIAPRDFSLSAEDMAAYRASRYSNVKIVWLDDIYNEFSAGHEDPGAIARFMKYTVEQWSSAPTTVLLIGKGSLDQKDRMGYADNFMPVVMTANPWNLTSSDSKLLGFEESAPFTIGRLPITNDEEGLAYIDKLRAHESTIAGSLEAVLVSDNSDDAGDFYKNSDLLADRLLNLGFTTVTKLYHPETNVRESLIQSSTWETGYVSYDGHGGYTQIGGYREKFITAGDAVLLQNSIYPVFTALTCAAGNDAHPGTRSLASSLVINPTGGAIASVAATGPSLDAGAQRLSNSLVDSLYGSGSTLGGALSDAKAETKGVISDFMSPMYSIVGEPAVYAR